MTRTDGHAPSLAAGAALLLVELYVTFPVILDGIEGDLLFYLHVYIFFKDRKSLNPSHVRTCLRASSLAVLYRGAFGPSFIV